YMDSLEYFHRVAAASKRPRSARMPHPRGFAMSLADCSCAHCGLGARPGPDRDARPVQPEPPEPGGYAGFAAAPDPGRRHGSAQRPEAAGSRSQPAALAVDDIGSRRANPDLRIARGKRRRDVGL
ncbi:hypothetical protein QT20_00145, partial [Staphylococcus aureus]